MGKTIEFLSHDPDLIGLFEKGCANATKGSKVIIQSSQKVQAFSDLFYVPVTINHQVQLKGMLDSGSMTCTISGPAVEKLNCAGVLPEKQYPEENIVLIGCGGQQRRCVRLGKTCSCPGPRPPGGPRHIMFFIFY